MKPIYLDNASTTQVDSRVLKEMMPYFSEKFGNASSIHSLGRESKIALEKSRKIIAKTINANPQEIIFTSGGTESNNLAIRGILSSNPKKDHIITTKIEHDSVINVCKELEKQGIKITYLEVDKNGFVSLENLRNSITKKTLLFSLIHGNNEIGTLQNVEEISKICKEKEIIFHIDACQSFTKTKIDSKIFDLITINSHKIHGPKGVGALFVKEGTKISPLIFGGGHGNKVRSGSENVAGIVGFAKATEISNFDDVKNMTELRNYLIYEIEKIPGAKINGSKEKRLCNNVNFSLEKIDGEALMGFLDNEKIYVSTGSACASHSKESSHVLKAIGLNEKEIAGSVRVSLSKFNTKKEIEIFKEKLIKIVNRLRSVYK